MAQKSIQGSEELAKRIRQRRLDLKLTIEEAASRAGVGTKTWCRYEAGESIRQDKYKGICKALEWNVFVDQTDLEDLSVTIREFKKHEAWSKYIEKTYGKTAAFSVAIGSDLLLDRIKEDLKEISTMPAGTHLGQLQVSFLVGDLPEQFLMKYDYDFLYRLKSSLMDIRERIRCDCFMYAENVMEEILIYLCCEEALAYVETCCTGNAEDCVEWVFEMFEDRDLIDYLYSEKWLGEGHPYHFGSWAEQFYEFE